MAKQWVGCMVSIKCVDDKGTFQGEIAAATDLEITLTKVFCDGVPCQIPKITVRAEDIADLKLIEKQSSPAGRSTITIAKPVPKRAARTQSISESASAATKSNVASSSAKSGPIDIEQKQGAETHFHKNGGTPNKKEKGKGKWGRSWKDEACFGSPLDQSISKDFDFEKNLALFNKQAIWDEINNSQKPDVVRQADHIRKQQQTKYRHDENIITGAPTSCRQIMVPKSDVCEYVTDNGLIIPSISYSLRSKLFTIADTYGFTWERRVELMGRCATELSLQLVGGGHRLSPHNTHQWPTVVLLCGSHKQGAIGINAARQLASHGINTVTFVTSPDHALTRQELVLYKLTRNKLVTSVSSLPKAVDLIIVALCEESDNPFTYSELAEWANSNRAPVLAIDPPSCGTPGFLTKYSLIPVLPLPHSSENGRLYLCNLSFPVDIFNEVGIKYYSPFGQKSVIPLHPSEDS